MKGDYTNMSADLRPQPRAPRRQPRPPDHACRAVAACRRACRPAAHRRPVPPVRRSAPPGLPTCRRHLVHRASCTAGRRAARRCARAEQSSSRAPTAPGARSTEVPHDPPLGQGPAPRVPAHHPGHRLGAVGPLRRPLRPGGRRAVPRVRRLRAVRRHLRRVRGVLPRRHRGPGRRPAAVQGRRHRRREDRAGRRDPARTPRSSWRTAPRSASSTSTSSRAAESGPALEDGDTIPRKDTAYPLRVDTLLLDLDQHGQLGRQARTCATVVDELGHGLRRRRAGPPAPASTAATR